MRKIIFRGKSRNGWLVGDLLHNRGKVYIAPIGIANPLAEAEDFEVDEKTVGQFTGLKDDNGKDIYEGDIIEVISLDLSTLGNKINTAVTFEDSAYRLSVRYKDDLLLDNWLNNTLRVIGNIHDNLELLNNENDMIKHCGECSHFGGESIRGSGWCDRANRETFCGDKCIYELIGNEKDESKN